MSKNKPNFNLFKTIIISIISLIVSFIIGFVLICVYDVNTNKLFKSEVFSSGELSIHFLELGNGYTGDCIYINSGTTDILIDAGSRTNSANTIKNYVNNFVTDGIIEYVIVTHADQDHIAAFAGDNTNPSLFLEYDVKTIIDFPKTNKTTAVYNRYIESRNAEVMAGAKHYTALECYNNLNGAKRSYELSSGINLNILYNYYYENNSSDENNYSVCFEIVENENRFLFTGDLEKSGEEKLVEHNNLKPVKLFKAGHHGSKTSSNEVLLSVIKPEIIVVTCVAGSYEYTQNKYNTFPTADFINRIAKYTTKVYVTSYATTTFDTEKNENVNTGFGSLNGNIVIKYLNNKINVECSNNNTLLKDTTWFNDNRTMPAEWAA